MAKKLKKTLCAVLAVIMAFGCFSLTVAAYTGYDHDGTNTSLKVRSEVSVDASSYTVGSTVTATVTLEHPDNEAIGWIGTIAFDDSLLEYKSATLGDGFNYFDYISNKVTTTFVPVAENTSVESLTAGYGGSAYNMTSLCRLLGTPAFTADHLSLMPIAVISDGKAKGTSTVITLTFETKAETSATAITLLPSYVFSSNHGYFDCAAPVEDDGTYVTAYSAIKNPTQFEITNGSGETYYNIVFNWHGDSATKRTKQGDQPEVPSVSGYQDDEKIYTFSAWKDDATGTEYAPENIPVATGTASYTAQYSSEYRNYPVTFTWHGGSATVNTHWGVAPEAPTDIQPYTEGGKTYTFTGWSPAVAAYDGTVTAYEATYSSVSVMHEITFNVNGTPTVVSTAEGSQPQAPSVPSYQDNEKIYTFSVWKDDATGQTYTTANLPVATGTASYTAQFTDEYKNYPVTFTWHGGSTTVNTHWGVAPVAPTNIPSYEEGGKTYTHNGWNPTVAAYDGTVTSYEATYSSEVIVYDIIFIVNGKETTVKTNAGAMPQAPVVSAYSEGDFDYTPDGWTPDLAPASADGTTYTAKFKETFVEAIYDSVDAAIVEAGKVNRDIYTADSLANLDEAIANADVEHKLGRTKQDQVNGFATAILNAIAVLDEKPADYTAYHAAKSALETELAKTDAYTPESIAAVTAALADIDNALDKDLKITKQSIVEKAEQDVKALTAQLVAKADKTTLKSLIDDAEALNPEKYVDFSGVTAALATANQVYNDDNATDQAVSDATNALRNALNALVFKPANYTAWQTLVNSFNNIDTNYYTPESVAAVNAVIERVKENQDINYQGELNALCGELDSAINALELIREWTGETDWEGNVYDSFGSNLIFTQKVNPDDASDIEVEVRINHPNYDISMLQIAALYDANAMSFVSAEIKNGTELYSNTKASDFNPADYSLPAMTNASVLKIAADFDNALAATEASEDLVMVLKFRATGAAATSYIKCVPLESNEVVTDGESVFSQILTSDGDKEWLHNDIANLILGEGAGGTITGTFACNYNDSAEVTIKLMNGDVEVAKTTATGEDSAYTFGDVAPGNYSIVMSANGSLGYTINNIEVNAGETTTVQSVTLLFGDYDGDGTISVSDFNYIITAYSTNDYSVKADVDGDGVISVSDINYAISHYLKMDTEQVLDI